MTRLQIAHNKTEAKIETARPICPNPRVYKPNARKARKQDQNPDNNKSRMKETVNMTPFTYPLGQTFRIPSFARKLLSMKLESGQLPIATRREVLMAMIYVQRLRNISPTAYSTNQTNNIFLTALLTACKMNMDAHLPNTTFAKIYAIPLDTLNAMEIDFLTAIDFDILVSAEQMERAEKNFSKHI